MILLKYYLDMKIW